MKSLILFVLAFTSLNANAADSTRYSCDDGHILLHIFEHRTGNGNERAMDMTLIYGAYVMVGQRDPASGAVNLKSANKSNASFTGDISVDFITNEAYVQKGKLNLDGTVFDVASTFPCKELLNY